jgi:hypothetical protein
MTKNSTTEAPDTDVDFTGSDIENSLQIVPGEIVDDVREPDLDHDDDDLDDTDLDDDDHDDDASDGSEPATALVIREVLERQFEAGRTLSDELIVAVTDATAAVVETPAKLVAAVRGGATLPAALDQAGDTLQDTFADAGGRIRSSVGDYMGQQATLPNAVLTGVAEVAGSVVRAQGAVTGSGVHGVMTVATEAARAGDIRSTVEQEWRETSAVAKSVRQDVADAVAAAREGIRAALPEPALAI